MLLLQPVLGREESVGIGPPREAAGRMGGHVGPWLRVGVHPRRRGSVGPNGSVSWHQVAVIWRSWDVDHW